MGTVVTVIIAIAVVAGLALGLRRTIRIARGTESCCGGSSGGTGRAGKRANGKPAANRGATVDRDPAHYPYTTEITVRGMSCAGCVEAVESALNARPGTWASVNLQTRVATVRTKEPADREALERAIEEAGYSIIRM